MTRLDIDAIRKTYHMIARQLPEKIRMEHWMQFSDPSSSEEGNFSSESCCTAACIAGWAAIALHEEHPAFSSLPWRRRPDLYKVDFRISSKQAATLSALAFRLSVNETAQLFFMRISKSDCALALSKFGVTNVKGYDVRQSDPLVWFDLMPPVWRKQAVLHVLDVLMRFQLVNWPLAMELASIDCGWSLVYKSMKRNQQNDQEQLDNNPEKPN